MRRLGLLLALLALAACDSSSASGTSGGASPLLTQAGAGFTQKLDVALDLDAASRATPAPAAATRSVLRDQGFSKGAERVWTEGDEYITALSLNLSTGFAAGTFVTFEAGQLRSSPSVVVYPDTQIPGAEAFTLNGATRAGGRQTFCQGVWYALGTAAYEVDDCADAPRYPDVALGLALKQFERDGGTPVAAASPSPSP